MADHGSALAAAPAVEARLTSAYGMGMLSLAFGSVAQQTQGLGNRTSDYGIAGTYQPPATGPFYPTQGLAYPKNGA